MQKAVLSTAIGCEGIDVRDGEHLFIADDAEAFARSCVAAVTESSTRAAMIEAAEQRYLERYQWSSIRSKVADLARDLSG